jgi:hypothetical protein
MKRRTFTNQEDLFTKGVRNSTSSSISLFSRSFTLPTYRTHGHFVITFFNSISISSGRTSSVRLLLRRPLFPLLQSSLLLTLFLQLGLGSSSCGRFGSFLLSISCYTRLCSKSSVPLRVDESYFFEYFFKSKKIIQGDARCKS